MSFLRFGGMEDFGFGCMFAFPWFKGSGDLGWCSLSGSGLGSCAVKRGGDEDGVGEIAGEPDGISNLKSAGLGDLLWSSFVPPRVEASLGELSFSTRLRFAGSSSGREEIERWRA